MISEFNIHVAKNPIRYFTYKGLTQCIKVYFGNNSVGKHYNKVPEECPLASYVKTTDLSALWWPDNELKTKFQRKVQWIIYIKASDISALWWP